MLELEQVVNAVRRNRCRGTEGVKIGGIGGGG
jgi:hypothetical protein